MVTVEDALDPDFCEEVIAKRLSEVGLAEDDHTTWLRGWHSLPVSTAYQLEDFAPRAAEALFQIVGDAETLSFYGLPDNLILNFPDPDAAWWPASRWDSPGAGWHKDGDWFRHFLDSPEQAMLGIVFWRDVTERQGPTYVAADSIAAVARLLAEHPEGLAPPVPVKDIVAQCRDLRPLTGRQGTIVWAHPFMVHTASVNSTVRLRIISNTSVMKREPLQLCGEGLRTPLERSILNALKVEEFDFRPTGQRGRLESERERVWRTKGGPTD
ncbi:MAG: hypothetical protein ACLPVF_05955 [Acidimicrobiales bacterium]